MPPELLDPSNQPESPHDFPVIACADLERAAAQHSHAVGEQHVVDGRGQRGGEVGG